MIKAKGNRALFTSFNDLLLLTPFAGAFEWFAISFLLHEPSGVRVQPDPALICWVEALRPMPHSPIPVAIPLRGICSLLTSFSFLIFLSVAQYLSIIWCLCEQHDKNKNTSIIY